MSDREPPKWEDVKKILDDPDVSDGQKQELAVRYASADPAGWVRTNPEVTPYLNKYDDGYGATVADTLSGGGDDEGLIEAFDAAKKSSNEANEKDKEHADAVESGKDALEDSRKSAEEGAHGGAGAKNSDELLDAGNPGLRFFQNFVPLYTKIENDFNDKGKVPQVEAIKDRYHEQRGMNFDKFAKGIDDLNAAEKGMRQAHQDMSTKLGGLWNSWTGGAAQASQGYFADQFTPTVNDRVIGTVSDAASMTRDAVKAVAELVRGKADSVLELDKHGKEVAGKAVSDWDTTIQVANGTDDDRTLRTACSIWDVEISEDCGDLTDEVKRKIEDECRTVTRHTFAKTVEDQCENFNKLCDDTKTKVDEAWQALNEELGKAEENPFTNPGGDEKPGGDSATPGQQEPAQQGGGQQGGTGAGGGAGGTGAGGGAGAGGAGSGGGAGAGSMPEAPEVPEAPQPEAPGEGPGQQEQPEKVTLGEGQEAVTVQEANEQGTNQVTLTGPDGQPKTYDVSFGPEGAQGSGGQGPGAQGPDAQEPGGLGTGAGTMPAPAAGEAMPGQAPGTPIQAGPDGKAVIEEGGRTITLEQAPDGGVQVEIDDGQGQPPLNQTIDFGDDAAPEPPMGGGVGEPVPGGQPDVVGDIGEPAPAAGPQPDVGGDTGGPAPGLPPDAGGGIGEPAPAPEPGTPPQVGGFDAQPAGAPDGMPAESMATASAGSGFAAGTGDIGAAPAGGPASTTSQSAGLSSMSGLGEGAQNSFGSTSGQLPEPGDKGGPDEEKSAGQRGAPGMAHLGGSASGGEPQGASGMASMGDSGAGAQGGQGSGQGAAGGGMMGGMGGMGGAQQQGGDQERSNDSPWRTQGQLFDDGVEASNVRFRSVLGEDKAN